MTAPKRKDFFNAKAQNYKAELLLLLLLLLATFPPYGQEMFSGDFHLPDVATVAKIHVF